MERSTYHTGSIHDALFGSPFRSLTPLEVRTDTFASSFKSSHRRYESLPAPNRLPRDGKLYQDPSKGIMWAVMPSASLSRSFESPRPSTSTGFGTTAPSTLGGAFDGILATSAANMAAATMTRSRSTDCTLSQSSGPFTTAQLETHRRAHFNASHPRSIEAPSYALSPLTAQPVTYFSYGNSSSGKPYAKPIMTSKSSMPETSTRPVSPTHTRRKADKPFQCDECTQSFNRGHDLKRHKRIHLTIKPYPCGWCEKTFSRKDALKRHLLVRNCGEGLGQTQEDSEMGISRAPLLQAREAIATLSATSPSSIISPASPLSPESLCGPQTTLVLPHIDMPVDAQDPASNTDIDTPPPHTGPTTVRRPSLPKRQSAPNYVQMPPHLLQIMHEESKQEPFHPHTSLTTTSAAEPSSLLLATVKHMNIQEDTKSFIADSYVDFLPSLSPDNPVAFPSTAWMSIASDSGSSTGTVSDSKSAYFASPPAIEALSYSFPSAYVSTSPAEQPRIV